MAIAWKTGQVLAWEFLSKHLASKLREDMIRKSIKSCMKGIRKSVSVITRCHPMLWKLLV